MSGGWAGGGVLFRVEVGGGGAGGGFVWCGNGWWVGREERGG